MKQKKRLALGSELEAVLKLTESTVEQLQINTHLATPELRYVNIDTLKSGRYQPRNDFNENSLIELAESVKKNGIIQPIIVRIRDLNYEIIAGERRWRAAKIAGLVNLPVIICDINDESALAFGLIENIQRQDLNAVEEALAVQKLITEFSLTHQQIAKIIGRSRTMVTNMLRILTLAEPVIELLIQRQLNRGHAIILGSLDESTQIEMAKKIIDQGLSVRIVEHMVKTIKLQKQMSTAKLKKISINSNGNLPKKMELWLHSLPNNLLSKVQITFNSKGRGRVVINFESAIEAEWLIENINFN